MILKILERIFLIFSNLLLSVPFTYLNLTKFDPSEIKANWQPPGYVFGIVWPILYLIFAIINFKTIVSKTLSENIKNTIISQSLLEAILQTVWLLVTSKIGESRTFIQYIFGIIVMGFLVYYCHFVRKPLLAKVDPISYYLYIPYSFWIIFAFILNLQILIKYYRLDYPLF
jgi:benzodiazapine receptor